jgi:hypothetical protein
MLNSKETLCVFLLSILLFSSFYSSSFFLMGRDTNNNLQKTYAQTSALAPLQQQQQWLQIQQKQQQVLSSLSPLQQQQMQNRGLQSLSPNSGPHYYQNHLSYQQQIQTIPTSPSTMAEATTTTAIKDTTPPDTTIISVVDGNNAPIQNGASTQSNKIAFIIQGRDNVAVAGFQCSLDNAQASVCTSPVVLSNLQPGAHILQVRAIDKAGNPDHTPISFSWNIAGYYYMQDGYRNNNNKESSQILLRNIQY